MKLDLASLKDRKAWENAGFALPEFDLDAVREQTHRQPTWLHLGAGNIFRAFPAAALQNLLNQGAADRGVIAVSGFGAESIDKTYRPYDDLGVLVTMKADGSLEKTVVASVMKSLVLDRSRSGSKRAGAHRCSLTTAARNDRLELRLILDKGSVEVFVNGGERVMSAVLPAFEQADGITFAAEGPLTLDVTAHQLA